MNLLDAIHEGWGWRGIEPRRSVVRNAFGNVIVEDVAGHFWRICPEDLHAEVIARSVVELEQCRAHPDFVTDWELQRLTDAARERFGDSGEGRCYCLMIASAMGGLYSIENVGTISLVELLGVSGDIARQIKDLPDGTKVKFVLGPKPNDR